VGSFNNEANGSNADQGAEELAAMVWNFVSSAGGFVQELDNEVGRPMSCQSLLLTCSFRMK
jgi:hypothetical protein